MSNTATPTPAHQPDPAAKRALLYGGMAVLKHASVSDTRRKEITQHFVSEVDRRANRQGAIAASILEGLADTSA